MQPRDRQPSYFHQVSIPINVHYPEVWIMQSMEFTYLVEAYRLHERRRRAEEEWRIRRLLAQAGGAKQHARGPARWRRLMSLFRGSPTVRRWYGDNSTASTCMGGEL